MQTKRQLVRTKYQVEVLIDVLPEIEQLMPQHYSEVSRDIGKFNVRLDRKTYNFRQITGSLVIVTARREGNLIGYCVWTVAPHLHYADSGLMAYNDAYFVVKEYRHGATGAKLLIASENILKERGVKKIFNFHKIHKDELNHTELFKQLGYELNEYQYIKYLK